MKTLKTIVAATALLISGNLDASIVAANTNQCSAVLISEKTEFSSDIKRYLSVLNVVSKDSYNSRKTDILSSGSAIIEGIPVSGDMNFTQFKEFRNKVFTKYEFKESVESSISYLHQKLSKNVTDAFVECLRIKSSNENGFYAYISSIRDKYVILTMRWSNSNDDDPTDVSVIYLGGTKLQNGPIPNSLEANKTKNYGLSRDPQEEINVAIAGGGATAIDLIVAKEPEINVPCHQRSVSDTIQLNRFTGELTQGCNICGSCDGPGKYNIIHKTNIDLACIVGFQKNTATGSGQIFDCSWNGNKYPVHSLAMKDGSLMSIIDNCEHIEKLARSRGQSLPANFCN